MHAQPAWKRWPCSRRCCGARPRPGDPGAPPASPAAIHQQIEAGQVANGRRLLVLARARRLLEAGEAAEAEPLLLSLLAASEAAGDHSTASLAESSLGAPAGWPVTRQARANGSTRRNNAPAHIDWSRPLGWTFLLRGNDAYVAGDVEAARQCLATIADAV